MDIDWFHKSSHILELQLYSWDENIDCSLYKGDLQYFEELWIVSLDFVFYSQIAGVLFMLVANYNWVSYCLEDEVSFMVLMDIEVLP